MAQAAVLAVVLQCALAAAPAGEPPSAPAAASAPAPAHPLGYLVGRWNASARDPASGETIEVAYTVEPTPGGVWLAGAAASADGTLQSRDMWGRDPLSGELIRVIFDGSGTFATVRSSGWTGERLVLEGEARSKGGIVRVRETITRQTPDRFEAVWEAWRDGRWQAYSIETVTRRS